jgi:hypothetical protein
VRAYRQKVGISHGDPVFLEPDRHSVIVLSGHGGTPTARAEPEADDATTVGQRLPEEPPKSVM